LLERIIGHTANEKKEIAEMLAVSYKECGLYTNAYRFFFKSLNEK
jgi:hypothetical protein